MGTRRQVTTSAGVTLNARRFDDGVGAIVDTLVVPGAPESALSRAFARTHGMSPRAFRKSFHSV